VARTGHGNNIITELPRKRLRHDGHPSTERKSSDLKCQPNPGQTQSTATAPGRNAPTLNWQPWPGWLVQPIKAPWSPEIPAARRVREQLPDGTNRPM